MGSPPPPLAGPRSQNFPCRFLLISSHILLESPLYGDHITFEQLRDLVYDEEALEAIHAFLDEHDVHPAAREEAPNGEYITVDLLFSLLVLLLLLSSSLSSLSSPSCLLLSPLTSMMFSPLPAKRPLTASTSW